MEAVENSSTVQEQQARDPNDRAASDDLKVDSVATISTTNSS